MIRMSITQIGENFLYRIHLKTCFVARSSEKFVVKAGGEKGSEAY